MVAAEFVLFLNGGYGVGKSAALDRVGDLLAERGRPFSLFDVDWFHRSWPPAAWDPDNVLLEADGIAAVWSIYRSAGPRQAVVCGVIETADDRDRYAAVFGMPIRSVRLEASPSVLEARLRGRYPKGREAALDWHLARYAELADRLRAANLDESAVATDERDPGSVAAEVLDRVGLG